MPGLQAQCSPFFGCPPPLALLCCFLHILLSLLVAVAELETMRHARLTKFTQLTLLSQFTILAALIYINRILLLNTGDLLEATVLSLRCLHAHYTDVTYEYVFVFSASKLVL